LKSLLVMALSIFALLLGAMPWLDIVVIPKEVGDWLAETVNFFDWCWLPPLCGAGAAIVLTIRWKPGNKLFRRIVITLSVLGFIEGLLWLLIVLLFIGGIPGL